MLRLALRNLTRRKSRTILTIMGITAAIAFMVGILSISQGFIENFTKTMKGSGVDIYVLPEGTGNINALLSQGGGEQKELRETLGKEIEILPNVELVYPVLEAMEANPGGFMPLLIEAASPEAARLLVGANFSTGRFFAEEESGVVLGNTVAKDKNLTVGDILTIQKRNFKVVGILKASGSMVDGIVLMPLTIAQELFDKEGLVSSFSVKVIDQERLEETAEFIKEEIAGVDAITSQEFLDQMLDLIKMARAIHFSLASIALLIGVLFVLTTMLMSVIERVREIGTLRAIGASRRFIFSMVLTESFLISLIGGFIGLFFGILIALGLTKLIGGVLGISFFQAQVTFSLALFGLVVALLVGILAGIYPAIRISRINIVSALRYE